MWWEAQLTVEVDTEEVEVEGMIMVTVVMAGMDTMSKRRRRKRRRTQPITMATQWGTSEITLILSQQSTSIETRMLKIRRTATTLR